MQNPYPRNDADTEKPLIEPIKRRWSSVAFSPEPLSQEQVATLFEAARWTQSSRNEQPWRFIYATKDDEDNYQRLSSLLNEGNQYATNAYLLFLGCAILDYEYKNKPSRHAQFDTGAAMNNIFLQAVGMGLVAHEMGGFDAERAIKELGIPDRVEPMAMMAVGYPGDAEELSEKLKEKQNKVRQRRPLSEIAFLGFWPEK